MDELALDARDGLPETLRILLEEYPREEWGADPGFTGLVSFWLERHIMFRRLTAEMRGDAEAEMDGRMERAEMAQRLGSLGNALVQNLHGHHQIEDHHYFPLLSGLEPRLLRGFSILDRDHHAMDGLLDRFAGAANGVIRDGAETGPFLGELMSFGALLERHLWDEEDLIVPVILKHGAGGLG